MSEANISKRSEEIPIIQKIKKAVKGKTIIMKRRISHNKAKSEDSHYVDNKEFLRAFIEYNSAYKIAKEKGESPPRIPDYIGRCFIKIAEKFSNHKSFIGYPYKDEMIADAIENCIMYAYDFDPNRGTNPFAYFTTVVWHAFIRRINKENKNKYIIYKSHQMKSFLFDQQQEESSIDSKKVFSGPSSSSSFITGTSSGALESTGWSGSRELYDNITAFIEEYERKIKEKKTKKKTKKTAKSRK